MWIFGFGAGFGYCLLVGCSLFWCHRFSTLFSRHFAIFTNQHSYSLAVARVVDGGLGSRLLGACLIYRGDLRACTAVQPSSHRTVCVGACYTVHIFLKPLSPPNLGAASIAILCAGVSWAQLIEFLCCCQFGCGVTVSERKILCRSTGT